MAADVRAARRTLEALTNGVAGAATIFALSSGAPPAAIGIIRISGPGAGSALVALYGRLPAPRRATVGWLRDPANGERIDRALLLWFPGPNSATGEDLAEFHVHGGRAVTQAVLDVLAALDGLRPAAGGEFTRQAFANGIIDLAEAEGLADLIAAETELQRRSAQQLAGGALSRQVAAWQEQILLLSARVEAMLDFDGEADVEPDFTPVSVGLSGIAEEMERLMAGAPTERLREGIRVVLAGPPNAGKSSLLNAITRREAAITAATAGTTRDVIEAPMAIRGIPFLFVDTAGLRDACDAIEQIGVDRARDAIASADILLWLGDIADSPRTPRLIALHPRCDQSGRHDLPMGAAFAVSSLTRVGVDSLIERIVELGRALVPRVGEVALNRRQREAIGCCFESVRDASAEADPVLIAESLRAAREALDRLTGRAGTEEMLDALFARFCIGK